MNRFSRFLAVLSLTIPATIVSASDDFGIWSSADFTKSLGSHFNVDAEVGFRSNNELQSVDRWDASLGLNYKPFKFFKLGIGYTYIYSRNATESKPNYKNDIEDFDHWVGYNITRPHWRSKNRLTFDATGTLNLGRLAFALRERYQLTGYNGVHTMKDRYRFENTIDKTDLAYKDTRRDEKKAKTRHYLRSRIEAEYNIPKCKFTPFASYEFSNNLQDAFHLDKQRLSVGGEYKLSKQHRLSLAYIYDNGADDDTESDIHVISIGYKFKF